MKKLKRTVLLVGSLLALFLFLTGCGSNKAAANKTLTFWYAGDGDTAVKPIINKFTKETGISVKIQSI
ncbi:MAG: ABC transporter substrate-binding protein, partial [Liquorilactobacillus satsumensis]